jgi:hypothetical protein
VEEEIAFIGKVSIKLFALRIVEMVMCGRLTCAADGFQALNSNTIGTGNTAMGFQALFSSTTGNQNAALARTRSLATQPATTISPWGMDAVATSQLALTISISAIKVLLATAALSALAQVSVPLSSPVSAGQE